jgi:cell wall-associated NlpC family hydrolase
VATRRFSRAVSLVSAAALSVAAITLVPGTGVADPAPSIQEVQARVDQLYQEAEAATERAHVASIQVAQGRARLARINHQVASQQKALDAISEIIAHYAADMYASGGIDPSLQMMLSSNPDDFLSQAQTLDQVMRTQDADLRRAETARIALAQTHNLADQQVARLKVLQAEAAKQQAVVNANLDEAQALLSRLKAKDQARLAALQAQRASASADASRSALRDVPAPAPTSYGTAGSGRGATAVAYARAQVGKPYVFGASGPSVFDCSGLTMAAWGQAGVYLPHSASLQYSATTRVSSLQPGDLVFFYSDISHVGMYVGGGIFVHAANPTDGVVAESLYSSYWQSVYMGAGRV